MITEVTSGAPVFTTEFKSLVAAIKKIRDYFSNKRVEYGIPLSKIEELDSYISLLPEPKYMDPVKARDQNNLVECLKIIGDLVTYAEITLYKASIHISQTCKAYYISYYSGYKDNWWRGRTFSYFHIRDWRHYTEDVEGQPPTMSCLEVWFNVNKYYDKARVHVKAKIYAGKVNEPNISVYFLSSGAPLPRPPLPSDGRLCVRDRGDVSIVGVVNINRISGVIDYDVYETININRSIPYVVVAMHDSWLDSTADQRISYLSISSIS